MNNIPLLIQGIGLVLVTLLIPIWISLFKSDEKQFGKLDEKVLVNHILGGKDVLYSLGLIFIPPVFWQLEYYGLRPLIIVSSSFGIFVLFRNLSRSLIWISGEKTQLRLKFLANLKEFENTEEIWHSVWKIENIDREKEYLDTFFKKLEILIRNEKGEHLNVLSDYLRGFKENLENRDISNILFKNYFSKLFDWYHASWLKLKDLRHKNYNEDHEWELKKNFIIKGQTEEIFEKNWKNLIQKNVLYDFIKEKFKNKIDKWRDNRNLLKDIFGDFLSVLFEETTEKNSYNIWDLSFPKEWHIIKENWQEGDIVLNIIWEEYYMWAFNRFHNWDPEKIDHALSIVTDKLFPEVFYFTWIRILIFKFTIDNNIKERFRSMLVRRWSFRFSGISKDLYSSDIEQGKGKDELQRKKANTFELAFKLFGNSFNEKMLNEYIAALDGLGGELDKDSIYEIRRLETLEMFKEMLEYKKKKD